MPPIARGSSAILYFAEEDGFGKPDFNYAATLLTVSERAAKGGTEVKFEGAATGLAANDWLALFTGDFGGIVQIVQVNAVNVAAGITTVTLEDDTPLSYTIREGDSGREISDFNTNRIKVMSGMVTAGLAGEVGQIENEALRASAGSRTRGASRPGSVTAEGGSIVVQPGTLGFASLLRHAVGARVFYGPLSGVAVSGGASTLINLVAGYSAVSTGIVQITVDDGGDFSVGDVAQIGSGDTVDFVVVTAQTATSISFNAANTPLLHDHADNEPVVEVQSYLVNDANGLAVGDTTAAVNGANGVFAVGDRVRIGVGDEGEIVTLTAVTAALLTFAGQPLRRAHADDAIVTKVASGVIRHELRKGDLPTSFTIYQYHEDIDELWIATGVRVGSIDLSGDNTDATVKATFNVVAKGVQIISTLPFSTSDIDEPTHIPYSNLEIGLFKGAVREVGINSITFNLDNEIETLREIGSAVISAAAEGVGVVTATFNYQLFTPDNFKAALLETTEDYSIKIEYDAGASRGESIELIFPNATITGNVVPAIDTATGLNPDAALESGIDADKKTDFVCIVESDEGRI